MFKRALLCLLALALAALSVCLAAAQTTVNLSDLSSCRRILAYSGNSSAYFYGYSNQTLYSARVIPATVIRYVNVSGVIRAVCHDESNAYALCEEGKDCYSVVTLQMDSGMYRIERLPYDSPLRYTSFAAADGEIFVIDSVAAHERVLGFCGNTMYQYALDSSVNEVFVNGNAAYAATDSGKVFRIAKGSAAYCADLPRSESFVNAGVGAVFINGGTLVSFDGERKSLGSQFAVKTDSGIFTENSSVLAAAAVGKQAAVLRQDFSCEVFDFTQQDSEPRDNTQDLPQNGNSVTVSAGTTVKQLCGEYPEVTAVLDADGQTIRSGKLKTGFSAVWNGGSCPIAVAGDVNGSGTVNSADVAFVMGGLVDSQALSPCALAAADYDQNGTFDSRDLVLIARSLE